MAIKKVGVVGGGLMGSGIAQTAAQAGYDVLMAEVNQELLDRGIGRVEGAWKMLSGKGRITEDQAGEYRGRFRGTLDMDDFSDRDLVIEAIIENQDEKRKLFAQLERSPPRRRSSSATPPRCRSSRWRRRRAAQRRWRGCTSSIPRR